MISKQFSFFCSTLAFAIAPIDIPLLELFNILIIPMVWIISGKKYVGYFLVVNFLAELPYYIRSVQQIPYQLSVANKALNFANTIHSFNGNNSEIRSYMKTQVSQLNIPNWINPYINKFLALNSTAPIPNTPTVHLEVTLIYLIAACLFLFTFLIITYMGYNRIKLYRELLRRIKRISHQYHR